MERSMFHTVADPAERLQNLKDTADGVEEVTYMRPFEANEMVEKKEQLSEVSILINDINIEKKANAALYAEKLKDPTKDRDLLLKELKEKANQVSEVCYKYFDENEKMACYYNDLGNLVYARQMTPKEIAEHAQGSIHGTIREMNGTNK